MLSYLIFIYLFYNTLDSVENDTSFCLVERIGDERFALLVLLDLRNCLYLYQFQLIFFF